MRIVRTGETDRTNKLIHVAQREGLPFSNAGRPPQRALQKCLAPVIFWSGLETRPTECTANSTLRNFKTGASG